MREWRWGEEMTNVAEKIHILCVTRGGDTKRTPFSLTHRRASKDHNEDKEPRLSRVGTSRQKSAKENMEESGEWRASSGVWRTSSHHRPIDIAVQSARPQQIEKESRSLGCALPNLQNASSLRGGQAI